ncbi:hypothetical protein RE432_10305 [Pusillimonas sp. SM2304]|uniref:hypothetical protein n=1 Tax=Pusillimonas sp. SM2304 TaxID=3073241 RepID=UPI00287595C2|nr:hypothetical protein [Pusillimonas sp. SM2304]MDS1140827.1 hypothetical protein [Pusillimonas sp. SM2304]
MKRLLLAGAMLAAVVGSGAAMARNDFHTSTRGPGAIYSEPNYNPPPIRHMERPRVIILPEHVYRPVPKYRSRHQHDQYAGYRHYQPRHHHYRHHYQPYGQYGRPGHHGGYRNGWQR